MKWLHLHSSHGHNLKQQIRELEALEARCFIERGRGARTGMALLS